MGIFDSGLFGIAGSLFGGGGSDPAKIAQEAADKNNALWGGLWNQFQGWENPYMQAGGQDLGMYQNALLGGQGAQDAFKAYQASTGFQNQLQQGTNAVASQAAGRGMLHSGGTGKALVNYGQQLGQQSYNNWLGDLSRGVGWGQQATGQLVGAGTDYGTAVSNNNNSAASAAANASLQKSSSFNNLLGSAMQMLPMFI